MIKTGVFFVFFLREYSDGLRHQGVANRALRVVKLTNADGTLHAEEVVTTGHQGSRYFTFKAGHAVPHGGRWRVRLREAPREASAGRGGLTVGAPGLSVGRAGHSGNAGD